MVVKKRKSKGGGKKKTACHDFKGRNRKKKGKRRDVWGATMR